ncbi:hypothetical protein [Paenibacillus chibensis]|uniref:hypothetical protein n=1 Tax=Paenibacillus chibensis TaxID=59846 RepID=UPI000FD6DA00|nr:hypothetical protein [Paenibacillus chibensis]MEC0369308.1 hypothetical protein [Paenibacillus chibensis]
MWFFWKNSPMYTIIRELEHQLRHLEHQIQHLKKQVHHLHEDMQELDVLKERIQRLSEKVKKLDELQATVQMLEEQVLTGLVANPELESFLKLKLGSKVRIETSGTSLQGTVIAVLKDAVQLREANGDLVVIPFSHINSVQ